MKRYYKLILIVHILVLMLIGCSKVDGTEITESSNFETTKILTEKEYTPEDTKSKTIQDSTSSTTADEIESEFFQTLEVHFFDVGQGDSILIKNGDYNMLIDGGSEAHGSYKYLQDYNITHLNYVIATHPHEDHIGGLVEIINNIKIDTIIMPNVTHTSVFFDKFLTSVAFSEAQVLQPYAGNSYDIGDAGFTIIAPVSDSYQNLNDYSIVIRLYHGENSFLFTGDIEAISESEIINSKQEISADVLKVAHHGSNTSTTEQFIKVVSPDYAVISCANNNSFGYPHFEVLQRLRANNIDIYRTDMQNSIVISSDGKRLSFNQDPDNMLTADTLYITENGTQTLVQPTNSLPTEPTTTPCEIAPYIGNSNTGKFHHYYCSSVDEMNPNNKVPIFNRNSAINQGYVPCKICNP